MGKRMMTTARQVMPSKKPAESGQAIPKRDDHQNDKPARSRAERLDWRDEGVVGNNHTD